MFNKKEYEKKWRIENTKKNGWYNSFYNARARCNNTKNNRYYTYGGRGVKFLLTKKEIQILWTRDKGYNLDNPSIDRVDNNGNYEFSNCRFIEKGRNLSLAKSKIVLQYSRNGKLIRSFKSGVEAENITGINKGHISAVTLGKRKTAGNFIWKVKN